MKKIQSSKKSSYIEDESFFKLPREWRNVLFNKILTPDELWVFIWLAWGANYVNHLIKTSYDEIVSDLQGKYTKNRINKILLSLMDKGWIHFLKHKGSRGSFIVQILKYPSIAWIKKHSEEYIEDYYNRGEEEPLQNDNKSTEEELPKSDNKDKELTVLSQKSKNDFHESAQEHFNDIDDTSNRSTNNDNNNDSYKNIDNISNTIKRLAIESTKEISPLLTEFRPESEDAEKCRDIAIWLQEESMTPILSCLRKYRILKIEETCKKIMPIIDSGNFKGSRGAYFNSVIQKL